LITGASAGIGEAMAHLLGKAGVPTLLVARRDDRLREIAALYSGFEVLAADLTTPEGVRLVEERLLDANRPIELLVNNAGFGTSGHFRDLDPDRLDDEIALNVRALVRLSHAGMRAMGERKRGWIMNVSSVASFQAGPSLAVYAATKAFVTNFSESLHEEGKAVGVKVTALCPGLTRTEFQSVSNTSDLQTQFPGFAWCTPEMVAEVGLADTARGKAISVPGGLYKGLVVASGLLPRGVKRWIYGVAMKRR
jgi:short-subunit dehydrogenase